MELKKKGKTKIKLDFPAAPVFQVECRQYTVTSRDVNFCYPDRVPLTQFVHIAKKNSGMWA
jgi:hypothetical protein